MTLDLLDRLLHNVLEVDAGQVADAVIPGPALPPIARIAGRVVLRQECHRVTGLDGKIHAVLQRGLVRWRVIVQDSAELQVVGVEGDFRLLLVLIRERLPV